MVTIELLFVLALSLPILSVVVKVRVYAPPEVVLPKRSWIVPVYALHVPPLIVAGPGRLSLFGTSAVRLTDFVPFVRTPLAAVRVRLCTDVSLK